MSLRILQWNCRSLVCKWSEFVELSRDYDVICINESFLKPHHRFGDSLKKKFSIRIDKPLNVQGGGVVVYIRDYLEFRRIHNLNLPSEVEWIGLEVRWNEEIYTTINIYNSPSNKFRKVQWQGFLDFAQNFQKNLIICGDFNVHSIAWGSELGGQEGDWFLKSIEENELCILNNGKPTKIHNGFNQLPRYNFSYSRRETDW